MKTSSILRVLLPLALLVCLAGLPAQGQNKLYVSTTGSDANNCALATPCATITRASKILTLGSPVTFTTTGTVTSFANIATVVYVAPGTYNECPVTQQSTNFTTHNGSASQKILYYSSSQYGAKVVCNNGANGVIWQNGTGGNANGQFVIVYGFDISGNSCIGLRTDGSNFRATGLLVHDILESGSICTNGGAGINIGQSGNAAPNDAHDSTVDGNIVDNVGAGTTGACQNVHGIYPAAENAIVQNNIVSRSCGWGIQYYHLTNLGLVENNVIINNRNGGILISASDLGEFPDHYSVNNNIVAHNGGSDNGIEERYGNTSGPNSIYNNNVVWSNLSANFLFNFGARTNLNTVIGSDTTIFVNYTGNSRTGDYHLKANIAGTVTCASGGITPCAPARDITGALRSITAPSVGAYEFSSTTTTATISVSPTSIDFLSVQVGSVSSAATITVTSTGTASVTLGTPEATLTGNTADFAFGGTGTCFDGIVLAANGGSCTITEVFQPQTTGTRSATLSIFSNASNGTQTVALTGNGTAPATPHLAPGPSPIAFGSQNIFTNSLPQNYTVTNDGTATLSVTGLFVSNTLAVPNIDNFTATDLTTGCNPSTTQHWCGIHDAGTPGTATGSTSLSGTARLFNASGTAFGGFRFSVYLGDTNLNTTSTIFVSDAFYNFTSSLAHVTNIEIDHNQALANGDTVIAGWQCNMTVGLWQYTTQNPSSPTNSQWNNSNATCTRAQWTLNVAHHVILTSHRNATGKMTYDSVSFDGVTQNLTNAIGPSNFSLGWTPGQEVENFQLDGDNTSWSTSVLLDGFNFFGYQDFYPQSTGTCGPVPFNVAAGSFCNVPLIMNPSATGAISGSVVLTSNSSSGSPTTTSLSGTGTQPDATLIPSSATFQSPLNNPSPTQPIVLTNTATGPLTVSAVSISSNFFQSSTIGTLPATIAAGASVTFNVGCTPTVSGTTTGQLSVTDNAPTPVQISSLSCSTPGQSTHGGAKFSGGVLISGGVKLLQPDSTQPTFSDTFVTGTLDATKWVIDTGNSPAPGTNNTGTFSTSNVDLSQGMLGLKLTQTAGSPIQSVGAEVRSINTFGYGTYTCTMRASSTATTPGGAGTEQSGSVSSCFTFINNSQTEIDWPEFEGQGSPGLVGCPTPGTVCAEWTNFNGISFLTNVNTLVPTADSSFHTYKMVWQPARIDYYVDGTVVASSTTNIPSAPAYIIFNHYGTNSASFGGTATTGSTRWQYISSITYGP